MVNKIMDAKSAVSKIKDGDRVMIGGFGMRGMPDCLIDALIEHGAKDLTIISNDASGPGESIGKLLRSNQVKHMIGTHYNRNTDVSTQYNEGKLLVTLMPQGTLAEAIRAASVGIPAFYTPTGVGTMMAEGKETRNINGKVYVLEEAIYADVALVWAYKSDAMGNLVFCKTARNFNPLMAMAANYTIVQTFELLEPGELDPECIVTPHIYVNAIVKVGA